MLTSGPFLRDMSERLLAVHRQYVKDARVSSEACDALGVTCGAWLDAALALEDACAAACKATRRRAHASALKTCVRSALYTKLETCYLAKAHAQLCAAPWVRDTAHLRQLLCAELNAVFHRGRDVRSALTLRKKKIKVDGRDILLERAEIQTSLGWCFAHDIRHQMDVVMTLVRTWGSAMCAHCVFADERAEELESAIQSHIAAFADVVNAITCAAEQLHPVGQRAA